MAKENEKVVIHHIGFLNNIVLDNNLIIINKIRFLEQTLGMQQRINLCDNSCSKKTPYGNREFSCFLFLHLQINIWEFIFKDPLIV